MEFAEVLGDRQVVEDVLIKLRIDEDTARQLEHGLYMAMKHLIAGHAESVIQRGVRNGADAWRKLCRDQLPLADDERNRLMTEFIKLKEPADASGHRHITAEIERITDN